LLFLQSLTTARTLQVIVTKWLEINQDNLRTRTDAGFRAFREH